MFFIKTFLILILIFLTVNIQAEIKSEDIVEYLLKNPQYLDTIDQKQLIETFSKFSYLKKFIFQNQNGSNELNWNEVLNDKLVKIFIKKGLSENVRVPRDLSNLFNLFRPVIDMIKKFINQLIEIPSCDKIGGLTYSTEAIKLPEVLDWRDIGFAKELINSISKVVVISGGKNAISDQEWTNFKPFFPYEKNTDRNLLFQKTSFLRSPNANVDCVKESCLKERTYKKFTWIDMAQAVCTRYIPNKTDTLHPEPGYLALTVIKKCQVLYFENEIFQLTDNKGNYYVMHSYEYEKPDLSVNLPNGWTLDKVNISQALIISGFGGENNCFYNIIRDNLGQGYHQYIYANSSYP